MSLSVTTEVPEHALRLSGGSVSQLKAETGKPSPVSIVALTGAIIDHYWWGPLILDPAGCQPRQDRIPLDWQHDYGDSIGYLDAVEAKGHELHVSGAVVPYPQDPEDIASKVLAKSAGGVPYQASVDFNPYLVGDLQIEYIPENGVTSVGGKQLSGPLTVVRKWPLNAVALCTHGYDAHTSAQLVAGTAERTVSLSLPKELAMLTKTAGAMPATPPAASSEVLTPATPPQAATAPAAPAQLATPATASPATPPASLSFDKTQLDAWKAEFGADLALAILTGAHTVDSARKDQLTTAHATIGTLNAKVTELETRLKSAQVGDKEQLSPDPQTTPGQSAVEATGDNLDQLTAFNEAKLKALK